MIRATSRTTRYVDLSSFPVMHKVGNVDILYCLYLIKNMLDREVSHFNISSKHHRKCKFVLSLIQFSTISNLYPLEIVKKCQCCQFCALGENSTVDTENVFFTIFEAFNLANSLKFRKWLRSKSRYFTWIRFHHVYCMFVYGIF